MIIYNGNHCIKLIGILPVYHSTRAFQIMGQVWSPSHGQKGGYCLHNQAAGLDRSTFLQDFKMCSKSDFQVNKSRFRKKFQHRKTQRAKRPAWNKTLSNDQDASATQSGAKSYNGERKWSSKVSPLLFVSFLAVPKAYQPLYDAKTRLKRR